MSHTFDPPKKSTNLDEFWAEEAVEIAIFHFGINLGRRRKNPRKIDEVILTVFGFVTLR